MKLTCVCPCFDRPQRTLRAIESVLAQDFLGWESFFIGDNCPKFQQFLDDGTFKKFEERAAEQGNKMVFKNLDVRHKGWGHYGRKEGIEMSQGKYICFLDNDDVLKPNHFSNYFNFMEENPDADAAYFNAYTQPWKKERDACLTRGGIGNAELMFKADVLKKEYQLDAEYEHDWRLVERMLAKKYVFKKCKNPSTYIIMSVPNFRETTID